MAFVTASLAVSKGPKREIYCTIKKEYYLFLNQISRYRGIPTLEEGFAVLVDISPIQST
jgi:hypothetical protein